MESQHQTRLSDTIKPYTRTPRQDRVLNADDLSRRLEAFTLFHDPNPQTIPERRRSSAAYVPRNAARAFQNTTTTRPETTNEAKRKTLPPQGLNSGADSPQNPEDGFSCAQLAYAHSQLQAYSDELRAKQSNRVPAEDEESLQGEGVVTDPDAYKKIPRRPQDRPDWTQDGDDGDEKEYQAINRLRARASNILHLKKGDSRTSQGDNPSIGDLPAGGSNLANLSEQDEADLMEYVRGLPRKAVEPIVEAPARDSKSQGDAMHAAIDAAKKIKTSSGTTKQDKRRSGLFDYASPPSNNAPRSRVRISGSPPPAAPRINRNNSDEAQGRALEREREEKALRRQTYNFAPVPNLDFSYSGNKGKVEPISPTSPTSVSTIRRVPRAAASSSQLFQQPPKTMLVAQAAKRLHDEEVERRRQEIQETRQCEQVGDGTQRQRSPGPNVMAKQQPPAVGMVPSTTTTASSAGESTSSRAARNLGRLQDAGVPIKEKESLSSLKRWFTRHFSPSRK